jgi:hypothetical protein
MNVITDPDLTPNEQAAIDEGNADDAAAIAAAANPEPAAVVPDPEPEPAKPTAAELAADKMAAAADKIANAADALATRNAEPAPEPAAAPPARDFDAERLAAKQAYEDGDLTQDEYDAKRDEIAEAKIEAKMEGKLAAAREQDAIDRAKQTEQQAEAAWQAAQTKFFADPGNAALVADPIKAAGFGAAVQVAFAEHGTTVSYDELLVKAREKLTGVPAVDTAQKIKEATFDRQSSAPDAPTTLRDVPNAGNPGSDPGASLDNLPIDTLEDAIARMSPADRDRYLASAPGN